MPIPNENVNTLARQGGKGAECYIINPPKGRRLVSDERLNSIPDVGVRAPRRFGNRGGL